jgi:predicted nucleic acid-binding protein
LTTIVVDASVAINWLIRETGEGSAISLLRLYVDKRIALIAPPQIVDEVASALSKLHRRKVITAAAAESAFQAFESRRPSLIEEPGLVPAAFRLSLQHQISFWDSLYLALAIEIRADLVTADERLYRSVSRHYPFVKLLS